MPIDLKTARVIGVIFCYFVVCGWCSTVTAQTNSLFPGGTGATGGAGTGLGGAAGLGGAGGLGTNSLSGQLQGQAAGGATQGNFIGRNTQGGFVGNANANAGTGAGQVPNFGGFNFGNAGGGRVNAGGGNQNIRSPIRPRQVIAFEYSRPAATQVASNVQTTFRQVEVQRQGLENVRVQIGDKGRTVLTGTVTSERNRKLAVALARLEPGVRKVVDELEVQQTP